MLISSKAKWSQRKDCWFQQKEKPQTTKWISKRWSGNRLTIMNYLMEKFLAISSHVLRFYLLKKVVSEWEKKNLELYCSGKLNHSS